MAEAKTKPTRVTLTSYLATIDDAERRKDCKTLAAIMSRVTGCRPVIWGPSIVGFDSYHYKYPSGHEGDSCVVGFSSRKGDISVYLMGVLQDPGAKPLLARLGKHKAGKGCLYVRRLSEIDVAVLEQLVTRAVAYIRSTYGKA